MPIKNSKAVTQKFKDLYLSEISDIELKEHNRTNILREIDRFLKLGQKRGKAPFTLQINNADHKDITWTGSNTIIEIIFDDMAFVIDSVTAYLAEQRYAIETIFHPVLYVKRDRTGNLEDVASMPAVGLSGEGYILIELSRRLTPPQIENLKQALGEILSDVRLSTKDWQDLKTLVREAKIGLQTAPDISADDLQEYLEFLDYIHDDNFTLLGGKSFGLQKNRKTVKIVADEKKNLGLLSPERGLGFLSDAERDFLLNHKAKVGLPPLYISKLPMNSPVHRRVPLDAITIRQYDGNGKLIGEIFLIGLFTSVTYSRSIRGIPHLRHKGNKILAQAGFDHNSHDLRALRHIIEKYPRDELMQIDLPALYKTCMAILLLQERPRIALFLREDIFGRTVSALVYVPKDRFDTRLRLKFQTILEQEIKASCTHYYSTVDDSPLVRIIFNLKWEPGASHNFNHKAIEAKLQEAGRSWDDLLSQLLLDKYGDADLAASVASRFGQAFPISYQEKYSARQALHDLNKIEDALTSEDIMVDLYKPSSMEERQLYLKLYAPQLPLPLSDILPVLENMGLRVIAEYPYEVSVENKTVWIQDLLLELSEANSGVQIDQVKTYVIDCLKALWRGEIEDDILNRLTIIASLPHRDIAILRSYMRYLRQTGMAFSLTYMEQALTDYPAVAALLVHLFYAKFDPAKQAKSKNRQIELRDLIEKELQKVSALDQDRILRSLTGLVEASLRTNFFQDKPYISIKMDSAIIPEIPQPRPFREIFVYSPRVEGIHLRADKIARGGLRWSDRPEDFRTEVLGLMKAQQVKNSVIVPMGSKGGFVVKKPPKTGGREAFQAEGIECYRIFIRGLLDITDNQQAGKIIPPEKVVRLDADDPYLVVAADKGTATFSNIANALSLEYNFWLGDAFASGGSAGYDHKEMGITARGAWESVKRHFREMGHDTQTQEFECVGVGDMGGDVFGNGMLQSKFIRLIGAFNHLHIFCDPNPDAASSFKERERLFKAVKGWDHYDLSKLSKGGRIFNRTDKLLQLTPEIQARFDLEKSAVTPPELIIAMLKARCDLLFFGGIGTYLKSASETNLDAGDRSNDALRINGGDVRASVIGEGANLGVTQRGRIEYALKGGRINTDFIDNSAGVDTSDHEVNIKILMTDVMSKRGSKLNINSRNKLLAEMTEDVAHLVLRDNYEQTQALSLMEMQAEEKWSEYAGFLVSLERDRLLSRKVEFLPNDDEIEQRRVSGKALTRPELSLILSYGKIVYARELLASKLPDDPDMLDWAVRYFPEKLQRRYRDEIQTHRLKREIIATMIANTVINHMGPTYVRLTTEKTGASVEAITRAYLMAQDAYGIRDLWSKIEALDNNIPAELQLKAMRKMTRLLELATGWFLSQTKTSLADISTYRTGIETIAKSIPQILPPNILASVKDHAASWTKEGLPEKLAWQLSIFRVVGSAPDIIRVAQLNKSDLLVTARIYFGLGSFFNFDWLRIQSKRLQGSSDWAQTALTGIVQSLNKTQAQLAVQIIKYLGKGKIDEKFIQKWHDSVQPRAADIAAEIKTVRVKEEADLAVLSVLEQRLRSLI